MTRIFKNILNGGNNIKMRNFTGCDVSVNQILADCNEMNLSEFLNWFKED